MKKILDHPFWTSHALLLARLLVGGYFLYSGIQKMMGPAGTSGFIESVGLPAPMLLTWVAILIEIVCGACIILGVYFKEAALVLGAFIVVITFIFHGPQLWSPENMQQTSFLKNMSIVAGLLYMAAHGAGNTWKLKLGNK